METKRQFESGIYNVIFLGEACTAVCDGKQYWFVPGRADYLNANDFDEIGAKV